MSKLKVPFDEVVCDYCHIHYPDERALKFHELIHVDDDVDTYLNRSGILSKSDHLPKAKRLLPYGIRNNRSFEINRRRVISRYGKYQYSEVFDVSDAIDELLDLCKKYPLRTSADEELLEYDEMPIAEKMPIYFCSTPNNSESISASSSEFETSSPSSPSLESASDDSEFDQVKALYEDEQISSDPISSKELSCDTGYGSSPEVHFSKIASKNLAETVDSQSGVEVTNLIENLVSEVAVISDDLPKLSSLPVKLKSNMGRSTRNECAVRQNIKFDLQGLDKPGFETFASVDENVKIDKSHPFQNIPDVQASDKQSFKDLMSLDRSIMSGKNCQTQNVPDLPISDKSSFEERPDDKNPRIAENQQIENITDAVYSMPIIC